MLVRDGERVAVRAVARPELPLEVGGPEIVRGGRRRAYHPRVDRRAPTPAVLDQPPAGQQIGDRTRRRPGAPARMPPREDGEELAGSPMRMRCPLRDQELDHAARGLMRAVVRGATPITEPGPSLGIVAREPLVPNPSTHAVAGAQLAHREPITQGVADKPQPLIHGNTLLPGHRQTSRKRITSCTLRVLPMYPDNSVTHVPGLYRIAV